MDTSSSARYRYRRTLNGTLCRSRLQQINAQSDLRAKLLVQLLKVRSSTKTGSTSLWRRARSLRCRDGTSGKCLWTNSAQRCLS